MQISRRGFLKVGLAGGSGVALAQTSRLFGGVKVLDRVGEPNLHRDFPEEWISAICGSCAATCPIFLRKVDGKIVGVRPDEPKPCPRAYLIPQELQHPDRLLSPLKRQGSSWQTVSRTVAVEELADILRDFGQKTAIVLPESWGLSSVLIKALIEAIGSPHIYTDEWPLSQGPIDALELVSGWGEWKYDISNSAGIISFGWDWLQNFSNPAEAHTAFGRLRQKDSPMIYVGPRLSLTAMRSNHWLACHPGFEPLVALSLAHMLIVEKKYDVDFCKSVEGFDQLAGSLTNFDLAEAERHTGVAIYQVYEVAELISKSLSQNRVFLGLSWRGRLEDQWAVVILNLLLGNFNKAGGLIPFPTVSLPLQSSHLSHSSLAMEDLPQLIMDKNEIETVVLAGVNPVFSSPSPSRWQKALKRLRHVVCLNYFLDETAEEFADLVIPLALPVERREIYFEVSQVSQVSDGKVTSRLVESASTPPPNVFAPAELLFELAPRLGVYGVQNRLLYKSLEEIANSLSLTLNSPPSISFRFPSSASFGWSAPSFSASASDGDFHLLLEAPSIFVRTEGARFPYLITTLAPHLREWWTTWVEINPEAAKRLGVQDKDEVMVESQIGSIRAMARLYEGIPPDAVCLPLGVGHKLGQFAQIEGGNPMEVIEYKREETRGFPVWGFQKVRIKKVPKV